MGAAASCSNGGGCFGINETDELRLSRGIDKGLKDTKKTLNNTSKVLLLGSGDSGKSTIIKQMRIINNVPFTEYEREIYRVQLFYNLVGGMRALLDALRDLPPLEGEDQNGTRTPGEVAEDGAPPASALPKFANMKPMKEDTESSSSSSSHSSHPKSKEQDHLTVQPTATVPPETSTATPHQDLSTPKQEESSTDPNRPPSRTPTRSPSVSLNMFSPGSLTQRQLTLLNEFMYPPDLRPGQSFPLEFESMLREAWFGITQDEWEASQQLPPVHGYEMGAALNRSASYGAGEGTQRARGRNQYHPDQTQSMYEAHGSNPLPTTRLRGAGSMLDRIERESGVALPDNLGYLYQSPEKLASFFEEDYMPSDADILRCRCRTTGIQETVFSLGKALLGNNTVRRKASLGNLPFKGTGGGGGTQSNPNHPETNVNASSSNPHHKSADINIPSTTNTNTNRDREAVSPDPAPLKLSVGKTKLHMVDVGGQRSERRKWIHCFQDVTAVLFLVGLSGYNQGLVEDPAANQMQDAMALWDGVCSSVWLKNTSLILFLNKTDLFAEKVGRFPISDYFPDYEGGKDDAEAGMAYFKKRFIHVHSKTVRAARKSERSRKDSRAPTTDSSTAIGSTNSNSKTPSTSKSRPRNPDTEESRRKKSNNKVQEQHHIATNTTSSHGVSTAVSFDSPRRGAPSGSGGKSYSGKTGSGNKVKGKELVRERTVYTHFTNATDTNQLRVVIVAVCDIILRDNFAYANLL